MAKRIRAASVEAWGKSRQVELFGHSQVMLKMLDKIQKFAVFKEPILITGESGVGKEWIASACHLLSRRVAEPFEAVNCPQYQDGNLTVSELFGHSKGSFTGAMRDHKGHLETARGGSVFLDEVADLHMSAQTMLLRALAEQEFKPLGSERIVKSDVRVISATNRPLRDMIHSSEFREDLYFRLRYFPVEIPPLREREDDWRYIAEYFLSRLSDDYGIRKELGKDAIDVLSSYHWPGNVRELKSIITIAYSMADGTEIRPEDFERELRRDANPEQIIPTYTKIYLRMVKEQKSFWDELYTPFMMREINRREATAVVRRGLVQTQGSYQGILKLFNLPENDYQKFMDFLRHHQLKPNDRRFRSKG